MIKLPKEFMSEAEVSLRLAINLASQEDVIQPIRVSIDGAQVKIKDMDIFPLREFMTENGWRMPETEDWHGSYAKDDCHKIEIHSIPGQGDIIARLHSGKLLRVESKKGPLEHSPASEEYPLMREAIGQLMTIQEISENDLLSIAVPDSEKFEKLASKWRKAPLIRKLGLHILLVNRSGNINGLDFALGLNP